MKTRMIVYWGVPGGTWNQSNEIVLGIFPDKIHFLKSFLKNTKEIIKEISKGTFEKKNMKGMCLDNSWWFFFINSISLTDYWGHF